MIKRIWITQFHSGSDRSNICIRFEAGSVLHATVNKFPPAEPVNGKKLNIDEAAKMNLDEPHLILGAFTPAELDNFIEKLKDMRSLMP